MNRKEQAFSRMCRVDGQKPTARDRWRAMERPYRLADKLGVRPPEHIDELTAIFRGPK